MATNATSPKPITAMGNVITFTHNSVGTRLECFDGWSFHRFTYNVYTKREMVRMFRHHVREQTNASKGKK